MVITSWFFGSSASSTLAVPIIIKGLFGPRPSEAGRDKERERGDTVESIVESDSTQHRADAAGRSQGGVMKQPLRDTRQRKGKSIG